MASEEPKTAFLAEVTLQAKRRCDDAEREYNQFKSNFMEAYRFCMPDRIPPGTDSTTKPQDADQNFTTLGEEVTTDFASDMADTFTPEHAQWAATEPASSIPDEIKDEVTAAAKKDTQTVFDGIGASNFNEACKMGFKDLAISAFGLAIEDLATGQPIFCQVIPINELRILRGPRGGIDTRLWLRKMKAADIEDTFPHLKAKLPQKVKQALQAKSRSTAKFKVVQGCYADYSVPAEPAWIIFTQIDGEVIEAVRKVGVGAANILVCRWDPDPCFAWGRGPARKAMADFREGDEMGYLKLKALARQVDPPGLYDDDQVMNFEGGVPNGVWIPRLQGSQVELLESRHPINEALYAMKDWEDRVRRHFYLDEPQQEGKTPPTAYQWQDESLRRQRRLGTPAAPIWPEFLFEAYMRFRYLLVQRGDLQNGLPVGRDVLPVRPMNPLKRAMQQEEAMATERALGTLNQLLGPQLMPRTIDVGATVHSYVDLSHANGVKLKPAAEINKSVDQMLQAEMAAAAAKAAMPAITAAANKGQMPQ